MPKRNRSSTAGTSSSCSSCSIEGIHCTTSVSPTVIDINEEEEEEEEDHNNLGTDVVVVRDTDKLYACQETIDCAIKGNCVPCAYKIGCFDVAQDVSFCQQCPNQRPEQCLRNNNKNSTTTTTTTTTKTKTTKPFATSLPNSNDKSPVCLGIQPGMTILTVGDGDFSFSLGLARRLMKTDTTTTSTTTTTTTRPTTQIVATSYETKTTLQTVYGDAFDQTVQELESLNVAVLYSVDATKLVETLTTANQQTNQYSNDNHNDMTLPSSSSLIFHRIIWNFPCTAAPSGRDGQNQEMEDNKRLVRQFIASARRLLSKMDGEIYMAHKTKPPYNHWNLPELVVNGQQRPQERQQATTPSLQLPRLYYAGRIVLDRGVLPPYTPRKALDRKSFPCHDACFFIFAQQQQQQRTSTQPQPNSSDINPTIPSSTVQFFPPTLPNEEEEHSKINCKDNDTTTISHSPLLVVKVTPELVLSIRRGHLRLIQRRATSKNNTKGKKTMYGRSRKKKK
ncbi:protein of unknown function DUF2431 containing protein [Nitzschia inconspicua]|uniref:25S rRNA (uridine-N(3))-methyltransferase BMT5-like domain-containing protein n=1 Tax=Nitzschia inconspicua TaxID=303405 RepID=A0A9K3PTX1_9STRA|nr:protein of unknown function DUF2431 containing protein [Nitzschia inconspicua]